MSVTNVDDRTFQNEVIDSEKPVLVDFWAPWCGPCRAMTNVVDDLASKVDGQATVVKVNIDEAKETARKYGIESIPSFAVIKGGEVRDKAVGVLPPQRLFDLLQPHLD